MAHPNLLIVDDEKNTRDGLVAALDGEYALATARDTDEALRLLDTQPFDIVLTDLRMAGKSGLTVVEKCAALPSRPVCVMMTAYGNIETAVLAVRRGAYDFLEKPLNLERLEHVLRRALQNRRAAEAEPETKPPPAPAAPATPSATPPPTPAPPPAASFAADGLVGGSAALARALAQARQVAPSRATVLLLGETGTGKELFARLIHANSRRAAGPFVAVHCAAIAPTLLESELFGHEAGAFTGARERRAGFFEAADGGTLFMDEIGEIDPGAQTKLLRVLETRTFSRVGSPKTLTADIRLVCATNRDLRAEVAAGRFREDLYYRLNIVRIELPPLRARAGDIPEIAAHYLRAFAKENNYKPARLDTGAIRALEAHSWPGNIRELRNLCENLAVMHPGETLGAPDIETRLGDAAGTAGDPLEPDFPPPPNTTGNTAGAPPPTPEDRRLSVVETEKRLLRRALLDSNGNRSKAAKLLGVNRRTIIRKLELYPELDVPNPFHGRQR